MVIHICYPNDTIIYPKRVILWLKSLSINQCTVSKEKYKYFAQPIFFFYLQEAIFLEKNDKAHNRCRVIRFEIMQANEMKCIHLWTVKSKVWLEHGVHFEDVLQNEITKKAGMIYITWYI